MTSSDMTVLHLIRIIWLKKSKEHMYWTKCLVLKKVSVNVRILGQSHFKFCTLGALIVVLNSTEFLICDCVPLHPYSGTTYQALSNELCCSEILPRRYECSG
jgi:hypothetical protein